MFAKIAILSCVLAVASAGYAAGPALATTYAAAPVLASSYAAAPALAHSYAAAPAYATSYASPALTATSENVYRSAGNLHSISSHTKSIATPFSSSNKQFTSVTNPGIYAHAALAAAPIAHTTYAAAAPIAHHAEPLAYSSGYGYGAELGYAAAAPIAARVSHGAKLLGVAYSPSVAVSHMTYSSPIGVHYSY